MAKDKIREEILAALKVAEKVQKPALEELVSDVYDTPIPALQKQYEDLKVVVCASTKEDEFVN